ncbi:hypothetical protein FVE85_4448 [Porphyridium purpureum]|uniref:Mannosylglycerate hydrolase MGH1-like glycoside hydrolase domain-containing protein n=1 Tax=Porphyridium purpureum TaxID=35688 RepID=A0A5J4YHY0_PORPP|nr:hypothetical protein FVE85_4448 [Porphyridium purpureum]|eukprot:POR3401..scf297_16
MLDAAARVGGSWVGALSRRRVISCIERVEVCLRGGCCAGKRLRQSGTRHTGCESVLARCPLIVPAMNGNAFGEETSDTMLLMELTKLNTTRSDYLGLPDDVKSRTVEGFHGVSDAATTDEEEDRHIVDNSFSVAVGQYMSKQYRKTIVSARDVLRKNDRGGYTVPTDGLYPFQWNWDASFTALGWSTWKPERAWAELHMLFKGQWDDGMIPSIVFHQYDDRYFPGPDTWQSPKVDPPTTGITQPPVVASCARYILQVSQHGDEDVHLRGLRNAYTLFHPILRYHRWFYKARDHKKMGRVSIHHPWESGMDNSPSWDEALEHVSTDNLPNYQRKDLMHVDADERPTQTQYDRFMSLVFSFRDVNYDYAQCAQVSQFQVADTCVNALLLKANKDLAWICAKLISHHKRLSLSLEELEALKSAQRELRELIDLSSRGMDSLWNDELGMYSCYDERMDKLINVPTSSAFLALYARHPDRVRARQLADKLAHWLDQVKYGVPSYDPESPMFDSVRYWRGPVWLVVNWMIAEGLEAYEFFELAERVRRDSRALIKEAGSYEYFDPMTGEGCGGNCFSWTSAIQLFWFPDL